MKQICAQKQGEMIPGLRDQWSEAISPSDEYPAMKKLRKALTHKYLLN